jgi:hypothetical protein
VLSVLEGRSVEETARELDIHAGMVYVARCKITKMLGSEVRRLQSLADAKMMESAPDGLDRLPRSR